jgi:hypothetical protein
MDKGIHGPSFLAADVGLQVEIADLASNLTGKGGCIKPGDRSYARLASDEVGPCLFDRVSNGTDTTQTGDYNATTGHSYQFSTVGQKKPFATAKQRRGGLSVSKDRTRPKSINAALRQWACQAFLWVFA